MNALYPKFLVFLQFTLAGIMIVFSDGFFTSTYALSIFIMGACVGAWALNHNKLGNFNIQPKHKDGSYLVTTGIYTYIRHPMYTSVVLMMFAFFIATPTWIEGLAFLTLILVLVLKANREEEALITIHADYGAYKAKSKYFIPYIL